ncbi:uncharacterized protein K460DRAFT_387079 [Cucurbitaria berberidis CBS 394.84]|uniref:BZIP domain-containing protein n=1 Tax=Cucurbitaria berberidis CBS 394.84 TaxID=1168544 RepID=A0A9P4GCN2_9PLEO|nr:uncharacterized protein K460DRAFT_387079 [Cucurbitaria berberidis CBS 394.84]KAF1842799.1 hypothetical protein K460DRAFT_387079 [Cucurbitaria berberidis CBS 394.84]
MSRKSSDTPSSKRIRENQRRSRNRRAELLNDLQTRVHEFERQGVIATQDMQQAARKVAQDNIRLRSLLALHGVLQEEVDSYLRLSDEVHVPTLQGSLVNPQDGMPERDLNRSLSPTQSSHQAQSQYVGDGPTNVNLQFEPHQQKPSTARHSKAIETDTSTRVQTEQSIPKVAEQCCDLQGHNGSIDSNYVCPVTEPPGCPNSSSCFCAPAPSVPFYSVSSGLEISCETAATIIAEMRGDGDRDSIRASLGCGDRGDCNIKNSTVLQVMDEGHG